MASAVSVPLNALRLNENLEYPVYSQDGTLLLAAGLMMTENFLDKLRARGIFEVLLNAVDAQRLTGNDGLPEREEQQLRMLETALNRQIDEFVQNNGLRVRNRGPSVADEVVWHGKSDYCSEHQAQAAALHQHNAAAVESMMNRIAAGGAVSGGEKVSRGTDGSLKSLVADFASTISTTFSATGKRSLAEHSTKMATLGMAVGIKMGFDADNVRLIGIAGMLADLGMAKIPQHLLDARRCLSPGEMLDIQKHSIHTAHLIEQMNSLPKIVSIITYQVHEKPDGSGYPRGRTTKSIHPMARIVHAADAYAAMTAPRPDRPPMLGYAAMVSLLQQAEARKQDPDVIRSLVRCIGIYPIGSYVVLSDGSVATVLRLNDDLPFQPIVRRVLDARGRQMAETGEEAVVDLKDSDLTIAKPIPGPFTNEIVDDRRLRN
ncbi:MAG TPA: HD domain-containing phosphohydrolase [Planctomycetaceae bacterium]|nr:HD domain-containing phosphohydrolase [Planctomycetaceae bacterium]